MAKVYGDDTIIECAQGIDSDGTRAVGDDNCRKIIANFQGFFEVEDLT